MLSSRGFERHLEMLGGQVVGQRGARNEAGAGVSRASLTQADGTDLKPRGGGGGWGLGQLGDGRSGGRVMG